jgi:hypothetical protein
MTLGKLEETTRFTRRPEQPSRSLPSEGDVRSVESFSGSMGKISAAVQTEIVSVRAWPSNAEPFFYDRIDVRHCDENLYHSARELLRAES